MQGGTLDGSSRTVRVVTYNVHSWCDGVGRSSLDMIAASLAALDPDIICLNEVEARAPLGSDTSVLSELADALSMRYLFVMGGWPGFGNAILAKGGLRKLFTCDLDGRPGKDWECPRCGAVYPIATDFCSRCPLPVTEEERKRCVRTVHSSCRRSGLVAEVLLPQLAVPLTVCATHLDHRSERLRLLQARQLLSTLRKADVAPHLLCGDMNAVQREDYSAAEWKTLEDIRTRNGWEALDVAVLAELRASSFEDYWSRPGVACNFTAAPPSIAEAEAPRRAQQQAQLLQLRGSSQQQQQSLASRLEAAVAEGKRTAAARKAAAPAQLYAQPKEGERLNGFTAHVADPLYRIDFILIASSSSSPLTTSSSGGTTEYKAEASPAAAAPAGGSRVVLRPLRQFVDRTARGSDHFPVVVDFAVETGKEAAVTGEATTVA